MKFRRGQYRALIVDDDQSARFIHSQTLTELGIACDELADGYDVQTALQERKYNILLIDLNLPGMNGLALLRKIRDDTGMLPRPKTASDVPVIMITGDTHDPSHKNLLDRGAQATLRKPIDIEELQAIVGRLLGVSD